MAQRNVTSEQDLKEARKLRELFKGRFSEAEAVELMKEHGGLSAAVDFVLNGDPAQVRKIINERNKELVTHLRRDSAYVHTVLQEGMQASIRLFACQPCDRYWWRKVPTRKEVSRCKLCKVKYDAVPREEEWGLGEFVCVCGNTFFGTAWMNHTKSPCYKCGFLASPHQILPPTRKREQRPARNHHSCDGTNCYNRAGGNPSFNPREREQRTGMNRDDPNYYNRAEGIPSFNQRDRDSAICSHERSAKAKRVLFPSNPHVSTGSTVNTFMSQGEVAEEYEDLQSMPSIFEGEED